MESVVNISLGQFVSWQKSYRNGYLCESARPVVKQVLQLKGPSGDKCLIMTCCMRIGEEDKDADLNGSEGLDYGDYDQPLSHHFPVLVDQYCREGKELNLD